MKLTQKMIKDISQMGAKIHTHSFIPLPQTPFGKEQTGNIDQDLQETIKRLISKGFAFGDWKKQEEIAIKISKYYQR